MNGSAEGKPKAALSDYLAAERTLLAWVRTGLALMGFGFVVARFGLFLQELQTVQKIISTQSYGQSLWFGTALIAVGVVVNLFAGWQHARLVRDLDRGGVVRARPAAPAVAIALFLAVVGLAMTIYLISVRDSAHATPGNISGNKEEKPMTSMAPIADNGVISKPSNHSVDQTVEKLQGILQAKGVRLFALVDHSGEAEKAGLKMRPTKLLIFGNPKAGTPVMVAAPSAAIDLPLKILVWEDAQGKVWASYNSPSYLQQRHGIPQELLQNISVAEALAAKATE
ncbi:MAG: DUF302 domain-containing protein [Candidatus Acidiferrales bacterium]|jgi:uncharacterized protein (DUF302 family)/uncharacterized membrane protein YidH (DUF202 family)